MTAKTGKKGKSLDLPLLTTTWHDFPRLGTPKLNPNQGKFIPKVQWPVMPPERNWGVPFGPSSRTVIVPISDEVPLIPKSHRLLPMKT